jgi:hypothetical protein
MTQDAKALDAFFRSLRDDGAAIPFTKHAKAAIAAYLRVRDGEATEGARPSYVITPRGEAHRDFTIIYEDITLFGNLEGNRDD